MPLAQHHPTTMLSSICRRLRNNRKQALTSHSRRKQPPAAWTKPSAKTLRQPNPALRRPQESRSKRRHLNSKLTRGLHSVARSAPHCQMAGCRAQTRPVLPRKVSTRKSKCFLEVARRLLWWSNLHPPQHCERRPAPTCRRPSPRRTAVSQQSAKTRRPESLSV